MIRIVPVLAATLLLAACQNAAAPEPIASQETSPAGLSFTLIRTPGAGDVAMKVAWETDHAYRADANPAVPHVGTQLVLAGGAEGFEAGAVAERFADIGAIGRLDPAPQHVIGALRVPVRHLDEALAIANAHLVAPSLDPDWLDRIREGLGTSRREVQAQPAMLAGAVARAAILGDHPLRAALDLDPDAVAAVTPAAIAAWHAQTFTRDPVAAVVVGDLDAAGAGAALDALLAGLPERKGEGSRAVAADFTPRRILLHAPDVPTTQILMVAPLPPSREGGEFEDILLVQALGGGEQSVLFEAIRTRLRAAYAVGAGLSGYDRDHRLLVMGGAVEASALAEVERVARETYATFLETGPSGALADRKAPLAADVAASRRSLERLASASLFAKLDGFPGTIATALGAVLDEVDEASLARRLAEAFPAADAFLAVAISPDPDALPGACVIERPIEAATCPPRS